MKYINLSVCLLLSALMFTSCIKEKNNEDERPKVELISPKICEVIKFGDSVDFTVKITDNGGLGNISMDIHNNFGHHNHGAHKSCNYDAPKDAVNPYAENWIFELPKDKKEHTFTTKLKFPKMKNDSVAYDNGDYHFHIYVTDNDGYQVFSTRDVKLVNR